MPKKRPTKRPKPQPDPVVLDVTPAADAAPAPAADAAGLPPVPASWAPAVDAVVAWIVAGGRDQQVLQLLEQQFPGLPALQLVSYALQTIRDAADVDAELLRGWAFLATKETFRRALAADDFGPALRAVKQVLDLAGE